MTPTTYPPEEDGKTYINVYSKGETSLGRLLTNFAFTPFKHPKYGHFASLEAFWYWYATGLKHDGLRRLHGASAKVVGRKLERVQQQDFKEVILAAIQMKIDQTPEILKLMRKTAPLPLVHQYVYGSAPHFKAIPKPEHNWQLQPMEDRWYREYWKTAPPGTVSTSSAI